MSLVLYPVAGEASILVTNMGFVGMKTNHKFTKTDWAFGLGLIPGSDTKEALNGLSHIYFKERLLSSKKFSFLPSAFS